MFCSGCMLLKEEPLDFEFSLVCRDLVEAFGDDGGGPSFRSVGATIAGLCANGLVSSSMGMFGGMASSWEELDDTNRSKITNG